MAAPIQSILTGIATLVRQREVQIREMGEPAEHVALDQLNQETYERAGELLRSSEGLTELHRNWESFGEKLKTAEASDGLARNEIFANYFALLNETLNGAVPFGSGNVIAEHLQAQASAVGESGIGAGKTSMKVATHLSQGVAKAEQGERKAVNMDSNKPVSSISSSRPKSFSGIVRRFLSGDASSSVNNISTAGEGLFAAVESGNLNEVKERFERGENLNMRDPYGCTPLHLTAWHGHVHVTEFLLEHGADPNAKTTDVTPSRRSRKFVSGFSS